MYLAIDPGAGRKDTIGWALFGGDGILLEMGQVTFDGLVEKLGEWSRLTITHVIVEEYRIRSQRIQTHVGSKVETIQTIGAIKFWARSHRIIIVEQPATILPIAQKWFQIKMPADHSISHQISATLHGMYWLHRQGIIPTALEEKYARNKGLPKSD